MSEKLLGVTIYAKLSFAKHIEQIHAKASATLKVLARIAPFMNIGKKKKKKKKESIDERVFLWLNLATAH